MQIKHSDSTSAATEVEVMKICCLCNGIGTVELKKNVFICDDCTLIEGELEA
ncbi:hypothetical protein [Bacillus subtilis]|uniref:hypothetical protein n=1 Tax=Bacillus subtilis TaxID=1423 RepID=UPI00081CFCE2|nr:hypothetical protein [Bacillus subtilis]AOA54562.1 hypothetical protein BSHJ0_01990 [Bacillus subtilis]MEC1806975.1 hypothetical protein [Bacillus subtilis]CAF1910014.1 hypothetical protein NRS6206_03049 [Bacillus subtilis]